MILIECQTRWLPIVMTNCNFLNFKVSAYLALIKFENTPQNVKFNYHVVLEFEIEFLLLLSHDPEFFFEFTIKSQKIDVWSTKHNARSHLNDFTAISHRWFMRIVDRRKGKMNVHLNPKFKLGFLNFQKNWAKEKKQVSSQTRRKDKRFDSLTLPSPRINSTKNWEKIFIVHQKEDKFQTIKKVEL